MLSWSGAKQRLEELSRWDQLRKLGASPLVRSSLAFAAAGYLLLWNERFQDYLTIKFDSHFSFWRIWMIYYGGISLAVATGLYSAICPRPIKDHATAFELARNEREHIHTMGVGRRYLEDVKRIEAACSPAEQALFPSDRPRENLIGTPSPSSINQPDIIGALIVYAWRLRNIRHPRTRLALLALFGIGFILIGIPALVTFVQVNLVGLRTLF